MNPKKIDRVDYIVMAVYLAIAVVIYMMCKADVNNRENVMALLIILFVGGPIYLFLSYSKRFRIVKVWSTWLLIAVLQALIVLPLRNNVYFDIREISMANSGFNLLFLVIMLPIFRMISRKMINREFDVVSRYYRSTKQHLTPLDYFLTLVGIAILTISLFPFISMDSL